MKRKEFVREERKEGRIFKLDMYYTDLKERKKFMTEGRRAGEGKGGRGVERERRRGVIHFKTVGREEGNKVELRKKGRKEGEGEILDNHTIQDCRRKRTKERRKEGKT